VLVLGEQVNGARRWLGVGPLAFQPSELAKLSLAIWASAYLARHRAPQSLKELLRPIGLTTGLLAGLILLEPDLGTVIAIGIVLGAILVVSGVPLRVLAAGGSIAVALGLAAIWFEPYRRARLFSFVHPWHDAQGAGFQTLQAIIGFGSGGFFGTGIGQGVAKVNYLPEAHTDMIFATIGEELGLLGAALVIAAYCAFAYAGLRVALRCRVRKAPCCGLDDSRLRTGAGQSRGGSGTGSADRNHAAVRLVRGVEPRCVARFGGRAP
jgi:cell division protein FtsW